MKNPCNLQGDQCEQGEINTGRYADALTPNAIQLEIERIQSASKTAANLGIEVAAGHGLTETNLPAILKIKQIKELNIGHHIIAGLGISRT